MTKPSRLRSPAPFHEEFVLSITQALGDQIDKTLATLTPATLDLQHIAQLKPKPGVYQIFIDESLVYVGKADKSLPSRLTKHYHKIRGRQGIRIEDATFVCLYVQSDFVAVAPERLLISRHRADGQAAWNSNGFGANDPGQQRDNTRIKSEHFDSHYPINLDLELTNAPTTPLPLPEYADWLRGALPYTFRIASEHAKLSSVQVPVPSQPLTASSALEALASALTAPWQIVALRGYVIAYPNAPQAYPNPLRVYPAGGVVDRHP
jgi:hypothetical protein